MKPYQLFAVLFLWLCSAGVSQAQRPTAPQLFSEKAFIYFRIGNMAELQSRFGESSLGKLFNSPELSPYVSDFYREIIELTSQMRGIVGLSLDELLTIPTGEVALAMISTSNKPIGCLLVEAGDQMPAVEILLEKVRGMGAIPTTKTKIGSIDVFKSGLDADSGISYFIDSGVIIFCVNGNYAETLARIWQASGIDHKPLSENVDFTTLLSRCAGTEGERPQISFFLNPMAILRENIRNSDSAFITLAAAQTLGFNGIKAFGGSWTFSTPQFDSILHTHLLLDTPPKGVLRVLKPKSGSTEPEPWIDDTVVAYSTVNWNFKASIDAAKEIVDTFGGEGTFDSAVISQGSNALGLDLRKDFLDLMADRITLSSFMLPTRRINSESNVLTIHMKKDSAFEGSSIPKLFAAVKKRDSRWKSEQFNSTTVYFLDQPNKNEYIREPNVSFAFVQNCLLVSDSREAIHHAINVYRGEGRLLGDAIEYKVIRDKITEQLQGQQFSIMSYHRPDEQLRNFYELARDPKNLEALERNADSNPLFGPLVNALKKRELPPFEKISNLISPTGGYMVEEGNGIHYSVFSLKRQ